MHGVVAYQPVSRAAARRRLKATLGRIAGLAICAGAWAAAAVITVHFLHASGAHR